MKYRLTGFTTLLGFARFGFIAMFLPMMPIIARSLSAPLWEAKYIILMVIIGLLFARTLLAIIGDYIANKTLLICSLILALAAALIAISPNILAVLLGTLFLSMGLGIGGILIPVMIRESNPDHAPKQISLVNSLARFGPLVLLVVSGYVVDHLGWQYNFAILAALLMITLIFACFKKLPNHKEKSSKKGTLSNIKSLLCERKFIGLAIIQGTLNGAKYAFAIVIPFLLIHHHHFPPHNYALLMIPTYVASILGAAFCSLFCNRIPQAFFFLIIIFLVALTLALLIIGFYYSLPILIMCAITTSLIFAAQSMGYVYSASVIVDFFPQMATTAISLLGIFVYSCSIVVTLVTAHISADSTFPLGITIGVIITIEALAFLIMNPSWRKLA